SINKDFERRALYLLFPKPISRGQYVLGKYLGMILLLLTTLIILGGLFLIGAVLTDRTVVLGSLMNLGYAFLEVSFLISLAVLFSTFTASLNAALYTIALFIIGHSLLTLKNYVAQVGTSVSRGLVDAAYYLLPNLEKFDIRQAVLYGIHIPAAQVWWTVVYWLVYTGLVLFLSILVIRKQEV
ncbi:ABC transporter permease subunit, partial [Patescibacteria group bacterium]|nr:ABC transporter permease subunit [Patescibacteria group bacterium]